MLIVPSRLCCIDTVTKYLHEPVPITEETQIQSHLTRLPIRKRTDVPVIPTAACERDVFPDFAVHRATVVPNHRTLRNEPGTFRLIHVVRRRIAKHIQRRLEYYIFSQLTAARALTHRLVKDRAVIATRGISHGSLSIVHRSGRHTDERNSNIVCHLIHILRLPFHLLKAVYSFIVYDIRKPAAETRRLVGTVKIDHKSVLRRHLCGTCMKIHGNLVVPVHKVNLEPLDSHRRIVSADILHIAVESPVTGPKNETNSTFFSIGNKLRKIDFRNDLQQIRLKVHGPALVENHILNAVFRREVDVVSVSFVIDARLEIDVIDIPVVPPVPSHFARPHPAKISILVLRR